MDKQVLYPVKKCTHLSYIYPAKVAKHSMISNFFSKTKPINYLVLVALLFLLHAVTLFFNPVQEITYNSILLETLTFAALLGSLFSINHIVRIKKVTHFNSYAMLFFVLLFVAFPKALFDKNLIFANFFLLLAFWRLLAIKTTRNLKHNLFDASFCIGIASLFYHWALLFLLFLFVVVQLYAREDLKNWFVPSVSLATLFVLVFTALTLYDATAFFKEHYQFSIALTPATMAKIAQPTTLIYFLVMAGITTLVFLRARKLEAGKLVMLRLVLFVFMLGIVITLITPNTTSPIVLTFFPATVFLTNYLERIRKNKLREIVLGLCTLIVLLLFALQIYQ